MKDLKDCIEESLSNVNEKFDYVKNGEAVESVAKFIDEVIEKRDLTREAMGELLAEMAYELKHGKSLTDFWKDVKKADENA